MNRMEAIAVISTVSLMIALGLWLFWIGLRNVWRGVASSDWPVAEGVVRRSEVMQGEESASAEIVVDFAVGGMKYATRILHFGQTEGSGDSSEAQIRALRYAKGRKVAVRYHPGAPEIACMEPGFDAESLFLPGAGVAIGVPGAMFLLFYFSSGEKKGGFPFFKIGMWLFTLLFGLAGGTMLAVGLHRWWVGHASLSWPEADAEIVYARGDTSTTYEESESGSREVSSTTFATNLVFRYEVNGRTHFSNLRRIGQLAGASEEWAEEIAEKYPKGKKVKVRYDPVNPDVGVIEPGVTDESYWLPGAGAGVLLFAMLVALFGIPALTREN